jgi:hypothetical protein
VAFYLKGVMTSALGKPCCLKEWYANNTPGLNVFVKQRLLFLVLPTLLKQQQVLMGLNRFSLELFLHTLQVRRMFQKLRDRKEKLLTLRRETVYLNISNQLDLLSSKKKQ